MLKRLLPRWVAFLLIMICGNTGLWLMYGKDMVGWGWGLIIAGGIIAFSTIAIHKKKE